MPKTLEGYVGDGAGLPLASIPATVKKVADGSAVASGATDAAGRWRFTGLPATDEYFVTLADGLGRAVVRGPWSGELREAWVRDRLDMPATAVAVLPGGANAFLGTLAFDPPTGAGALDARYVNTSGDTMTGALAVPSLTVGGNDLSQATLDARYVNTAGDAMSGTLTLPSLSVAGNDISYPSLDARYVNATGDAMTGALAVPSLTVAGVAINQTALDARYVNSDGDAMTGALVVNGLAVAASPDASNALEWRANGFFATAGGGGGPSGTNVAAWVTRVANQSIGNASDTPISFDTEVRDDGGYWASGSPTRITISTTGWYGFAGWLIYAASTVGIRYVHLKKNNTDYLATTSSGPHTTDGSARLTVAMNLYLVAGDYLEMIAFQNSGGSLTAGAALSVVGLGAAAPAGAPTTAPYITTAPDAGLSNEVLLASVIGYGTNAAMPAVGTAGRLYYDTTNSRLMRDSGSAWQSVEGAGGGGGLTKAEADTYYEPLDSAYTKAESDGRYEPLDSAYTKAEADARYPQKTDLDPYPQYLTQTEGDARYTQGGITQAAADLRYEPIDTMYTKAESDARFVNLAGGSVMTGLLGPTTTNTRDLGTSTLRWRSAYLDTSIEFGTAVSDQKLVLYPGAVGVGFYLGIRAGTLWYNAGQATNKHSFGVANVERGSISDTAFTTTVPHLPSATNTLDLGATATRWRKLWTVDAEFTNTPTVGGVAMLTATSADALFLTPAEGNAAYATAAHNHDTAYVKLAGGSVMTGLLGPTTTNTQDLGTTALRWRKLWSVDGEFTNVPTVGGVALLTQAAADLRYEPIDTMYTKAESDARYTQGGITQAAADLRYEPLDSAYTKAEDDARFVQLTGGSVMTGLLGPTTTNTRDLGTTTLRWRKLWAVDADLSGALTVGTGPLTVTAGGVAVTGASTFSVAPTVGGSALLTATAGDAAYVNTTGDTMTGVLTLTNRIVQSGDYAYLGNYNTTLAGTTYPRAGNDLAIGWNTGAGSRDIAFVNTDITPASISFIWRQQTGVSSWSELLRLTNTGQLTPAGGLTTNTLQVNTRPVIMAGCHVYHNVSQSITNALETNLAFNAERFDTDAFHDTVTNNTRLTVPTGLAGKYLVWAVIEWAAKADATLRLVRIVKNNITTIAFVNSANSNNAGYNFGQPVSVVVDLVVGDYIECRVRQESGAALNATSNTDYSPAFGMQRIG